MFTSPPAKCGSLSRGDIIEQEGGGGTATPLE